MIDLLAEEAGVAVEVAEITRQAMEGSVDFETALRKRVRLLAGLSADAIDRVAERIVLTPGARTFVATLKKLGMTVGVVSGGFTVFTDRLVERLDLDHAVANELEIVDGVVTGELVGPVVDRQRKAQVLRELCAAHGVPVEQSVAIGDGANDLDLLAAAGLGIAFNAKPVVRDAADTSLSVPYLDAALFLLGIPREDISGTDDR
jgi:phosphoserine phosphatase